MLLLAIENGGSATTKRLRVRLADGNEGTIAGEAARPQIFEKLPILDGAHLIPVSTAQLDEQLIGMPLSELEKRYTSASAIVEVHGIEYAHLRDLVVSTGPLTVRQGVLVQLAGRKRVAQSWIPTGTPQTKLYNLLPLAKQIRESALPGLLSPHLRPPSRNRAREVAPSEVQPWHGAVLASASSASLTIGTLLAIFSVPFLLVTPVTAAISACPLFGNRTVVKINTTLYCAATYGFLVLLMMSWNSAALPVILGALPLIFWCKVVVRQIRRQRCPHCHHMDSATTLENPLLKTCVAERWMDYKVHFHSAPTFDVGDGNDAQKQGSANTRQRHHSGVRHCACCGRPWETEEEESRFHFEVPRLSLPNRGAVPVPASGGGRAIPH